MPTATRIRDQCLAPGRAVDAPAPGGGYRRLFPELDPLECEDDALHALGRPGGACDAAAAAVEVRADGTGPPDPDAQEAAGWPVFGQFLAHDITADRSPLTHHAELAEIRNIRSPGPTSRSCTATARAACRSCTTATTRPSCWSAATTPAGRPTCPATPRGWPWSATPATTSTC